MASNSFHPRARQYGLRAGVNWRHLYSDLSQLMLNALLIKATDAGALRMSHDLVELGHLSSTLATCYLIFYKTHTTLSVSYSIPSTQPPCPTTSLNHCLKAVARTPGSSLTFPTTR